MSSWCSISSISSLLVMLSTVFVLTSCNKEPIDNGVGGNSSTFSGEWASYNKNIVDGGYIIQSFLSFDKNYSSFYLPALDSYYVEGYVTNNGKNRTLDVSYEVKYNDGILYFAGKSVSYSKIDNEHIILDNVHYYRIKGYKDFPATSITIDKNLNLKVGNSYQLQANYAPLYTNETVTWSSNNTSVATVNNGKVVGVSVGNAVITASIGGVSADCAVVVKSKTDYITFKDAGTKSICVSNWDTDKDNELSYEEAKAVTDIGQVFNHSKSIGSFDEFQYFTSVTSLPERAFETSTIKSINLPSSITSIGKMAFVQCYGLTSVSIPNSVEFIGGGAFRECTSLSQITIPDSVKEMGGSVLSYCVALTNVKLPEGITELGNSFFINCNQMTSIVLPNSIKKIGKQAFYICKSLHNINMPTSLEVIGEDAFGGVSELETVDLPASLIQLDERALDTVINHLIINSTFTFQGWPFGAGPIGTLTINTERAFNLFSGRNSITNLVLSSKVKEVAKSAFSSVGLESVIIQGDKVIIGDSAFYKNPHLTTFDFSRVAELGQSAFRETGLRSITIPEGFKSIPIYCFSWCDAVTEIKLPSTLDYIGDGAFLYCSQKPKVIIRATTPPTLGGNNCFKANSIYPGEKAGYPIYVPVGSVAEYKNKWSLYADYINPIIE